MADLSLQLQADNLPADAVEKLLVDGHWAPILRRLLTAENLLLEGCRGVGKTMLMRTAAARSTAEIRRGVRTMGVHATFKRYLATIPPPDSADGDALGNFKAWVNARILSALKDQLETCFPDALEHMPASLNRVKWKTVISLLETTYRGAVRSADILNSGLSSAEFQGLQGYTFTSSALSEVRQAFNLDLIVLLLDDAAHALDIRAQGEFFTTVKALFGEGLAFKISVYPAVTRYGLDFSYGHDAVVVTLGDLPTPDAMPAFFELLRRRAELGAGDTSQLINHLISRHDDWVKLLVYCSNGNPRGLLKLISQLLTELRERSPEELRYDDVRNSVNYVMDRHLDNMVPGIVKDLDPRLLRCAELLLDGFRDKLINNPGPTVQSGQSRMFLAITNSMQIPYLCTASVRLLVAANVLSPAGPARLSQRENGTAFLLHPGFVFRDNALAGGTGTTVPVERWLHHFDTMASRFHAEVSKSANLWRDARDEANNEPSARCLNAHPIFDTSKPCDICGSRAIIRAPAEILLEKHVSVLDLSDRIIQRLSDSGYNTVRKVFEASPQQLDDIPYIGSARTQEIRSAVEAAVDEFLGG